MVITAYLFAFALVLLKHIRLQAAELPDLAGQVLTACQELSLAGVQCSSLTALLSSSC